VQSLANFQLIPPSAASLALPAVGIQAGCRSAAQAGNPSPDTSGEGSLREKLQTPM